MRSPLGYRTPEGECSPCCIGDVGVSRQCHLSCGPPGLSVGQNSSTEWECSPAVLCRSSLRDRSMIKLSLLIKTNVLSALPMNIDWNFWKLAGIRDRGWRDVKVEIISGLDARLRDSWAFILLSLVWLFWEKIEEWRLSVHVDLLMAYHWLYNTDSD